MGSVMTMEPMNENDDRSRSARVAEFLKWYRTFEADYDEVVDYLREQSEFVALDEVDALDEAFDGLVGSLRRNRTRAALAVLDAFETLTGILDRTRRDDDQPRDRGEAP